MMRITHPLQAAQAGLVAGGQLPLLLPQQLQLAQVLAARQLQVPHLTGTKNSGFAQSVNGNISCRMEALQAQRVCSSARCCRASGRGQQWQLRHAHL